MMGRRHTFVVGTLLGSLALVTASCGSSGGRSAAASPAAGTSKPASAGTVEVAISATSWSTRRVARSTSSALITARRAPAQVPAR